MPKRDDRRFRFTAPMERQPGRYGWSYVAFPHDVQEIFGRRGEVRVKCLINGVPADRALMPTRSGLHIIALSATLRRQAGIEREGDEVEVELWADPEPDSIDVPEELAATLVFMPDLATDWNKLTPGVRRSMCYWIASARTSSTREKRVVELVRRWEHKEAPFGPSR